MSRIVLAALALIPMSVAWAQDAFDLYVANVALMVIKPVQKELKVTEAQRAKMNVHADAYNKALDQIRKELAAMKADPSKPLPEAMQRRRDAALRKMSDAVLGQLTPIQLRRLREISLQHAGPPALGDDKVGARLKITAAQQTQVRKIFQAALQESVELEDRMLDPVRRKYSALRPKSEAEAKKLQAEFDKELQKQVAVLRPKVLAIRKKADERALAALSTSQRAGWTQLLGKPFKLPDGPIETTLGR